MNVGGSKEKPKKKKKPRKIMNPDDTIKNGPFSWRVETLLGSGGFGDVYKVYDEKNKAKHYALKTESEDGKKSMLRLKVEVKVFMTITEGRKTNPNGFKHFVEFVDRGKSEDLGCKFVVMSLVGPSLDDVRKKYGVTLNDRSTPYIVAIQSLEAVRDLHSVGFLHRDIKPANFAVGFGPTEPTVFMLDFGIGRSYLDPKTKQHRAPRKSVKFLGTLRYASRACIKGIDQGRKDDVECWIYMVFDIFDPEEGIVWKKVAGRDKITRAKEKFFEGKSKEAYKLVPYNLKTIVSYVDSLRFQSAPDYPFMINYLFTMSNQAGFPINDMNKGAWVGSLKNKKTGTGERTDKLSGSNDSDT
uniref:Protein kinase domain-containing protein n=1 Tax=Caenorhabditis tropicalis TaxID=1561998 RepID=A0A1I7V2I9_9PELO